VGKTNSTPAPSWRTRCLHRKNEIFHRVLWSARTNSYRPKRRRLHTYPTGSDTKTPNYEAKTTGFSVIEVTQHVEKYSFPRISQKMGINNLKWPFFQTEIWHSNSPQHSQDQPTAPRSDKQHSLRVTCPPEPTDPVDNAHLVARKRSRDQTKVYNWHSGDNTVIQRLSTIINNKRTTERPIFREDFGDHKMCVLCICQLACRNSYWTKNGAATYATAPSFNPRIFEFRVQRAFSQPSWKDKAHTMPGRTARSKPSKQQKYAVLSPASPTVRGGLYVRRRCRTTPSASRSSIRSRRTNRGNGVFVV